MNDNLPTIRKATTMVCFDDEATRETVAYVVDRIDHMKRVLREADQQLKQSLLAWLERNGEITIGENRYYAGTKKTTKARNPEQVLEALLTATGGDFAKVCDCLSANAWKHGAARGVLDDADYERCFETVEDKDVKTGKPKREVKQINPRFVR